MFFGTILPEPEPVEEVLGWRERKIGGEVKARTAAVAEATVRIRDAEIGFEIRSQPQLTISTGC